MKGLIGFITAIFLISLSAGLFYVHRNVTKEPTNEVPDSTMTFEPDTTAAQDNFDMWVTVLVLEQIQNSQNL